MEKLQSGILAEKIKFDMRIGVLRDRSVEWLVNGYNAINNETLVKKAWELCRVPGTSFNFSHASLDSEEARQALNALVRDDPAFYNEITSGKSEKSIVNDTQEVVEDLPEAWELDEGDDISLSMKTVIARTIAPELERDAPDPISDLDDYESDPEYLPLTYAAKNVSIIEPGLQEESSSSARGKRVSIPNKRYNNASWTRFDASDDEDD
ncbi:hypothetical protein BDY19DRAFT_107089 [Irpex rosettiformis]|uniref:Uncharacterized protein n=1 Tax=Irpex rosettiformis TaxID=378272 RepID=A0ACB8U5B3_9APHY|nr:hypothetical protein BDY19DRAFT_107089 [Irpex rosettiformis]